MPKRLRIILPIVLLMALSYGGYTWWGQTQDAGAGDALTASGTVESEQVLITAEIAGRVKSLGVDEGQQVSDGQPLAQLDTALLEAQLAQAKAAESVADANLALLKAGPRPEDLASAEAEVRRAQAARDGAAVAAENASAIAANPQELSIQIAQAQAARDAARRALEKLRAGSRPEDIAQAQAAAAQAVLGVQASKDRLSLAKTQAETAEQQASDALTQAQARYAQAKLNWAYAEATGNDPIAPVIYSQQTGQKLRDNKLSDEARAGYYSQFVQVEAALHQAESAVALASAQSQTARQAEVNGIGQAEAQSRAADASLTKVASGAPREDLAQAETALASAQRTLDLLLTIRKDPQQLKAAAAAAAAQFAQTDAALAQSQARQELVAAGARAEQIQAAQAQREQAEAARQQVEVQLTKATLVAPRAGVILSRPIHQGEQASVGATLMTIGALDPLRLTLYVPEAEIGRVKLGQMVDVAVDSFPNKRFAGEVTFIAQAAEFTPRSVQTKDERATTVFAVRVELRNPEGELKPGMPADATFR